VIPIEGKTICARIIKIIYLVMVKGKAIPLQAWTDSGGSRKMKLPDFKTIST
jgi:hypothetical protein